MDLSGLLGGGGGSSSTGGSSSSGGSSLLGGLPLLGFGSSTSGTTLRDDRLPPHIFTTVTSVLYGLAVAAFLLRLYIRLALQRRLYIDDAFNIFSLILLTISVAAYYVYRNEAFAEEDLIDGDYAALLQSDIISKGLLVRKWITAAAIMLWTVVNFTKLSFLFFFRRLISRLRWFTVYWWIVLAYVTVVWGWGISIFLAPCPKLTSLENALQCITGPKAELAVRYSFAQVALDIFGDLLILAIPVKLIWQVRIRWTQKIGLMTSLCLSIAMVGTSAARATGILRNGYLDSLWVIFWYFNSANIALTLSCAAAFRTLYLAHRRSRSPRGGADDEDSSGESGSRGGKACKLSGIKVGIKQIFLRDRFTPQNTDNRNGNSNRGKWPKGSDPSCSTSEDGSRGNSAANPAAMRELPRPPRAMMTGLRTFIGRNGRDSFLGLESTTMNSEEDLTLSAGSKPLPPPPAAHDGRERTSTVDVQTRERWS